MIEIVNKLKKYTDPQFLSAGRILTALIAAFLFVNSLMIIGKDFTTLTKYIASFNAVYFAVNIVIVALWLLAVSKIFGRDEIITFSLLISTVIFCVILAAKVGSNIYFDLGLSIIIFVIIRWLTVDDKLNLDAITITWRTVLITTSVLFILLTAFISYFTIMRYNCYSSATFDFGIFTQMFENMFQTGLPNTTVERNIAMSHFGIHFSPSLYLLLPGYFLFPRPEYLLVAQAFCVFLGMFAVYGISKKLLLSPKVTMAFVVIYAFFPSVSSGCFYDFHENKLLPVLILFTIYFIVSNKTIPTFLFALLTLGVKEDAAIYIAAIAIFMIISRKKYLNGIIMLVMTVVYFMAAKAIVASLGEGVMMWRLSDYFIGNDVSFASVIKACVYDIGFLVKNIFTAKKLEFIFWMLLPVTFTPILNEKLSTLFLLVPMLVINLMPSWLYQYNVDYQYTYGVAALIVTASVFSLAEMKTQHKRFLLLSSMVISIVLCSSLVFPKIKAYKNIYKVERESTVKITREINNLRDNVLHEYTSVSASQYLIPHLYFQYKNLYSLPDSIKKMHKTDYFLIDTRDKYAEGYDCRVFMADDYELVSETGFLQVYKLKK